jgi:hypothetical protein
MADATSATVMDAVFAMDAYEHNPDNGSWALDLTRFFPNLTDGQLGIYSVGPVSTQAQQKNDNFFGEITKLR